MVTMIETGAPADIMIVDDVMANLQMLAGMLKQRGYKVRPVPSGRLALQAAERSQPDLILLDINMPDMDGYETCARLKADERLCSIPVIFLSGLSETIDKVRAFQVGGVDYMTKPFQFEEVLARVETHLRLRCLQRELELHNAHLEELVQEQVREISESQLAIVYALAKLAESRDDQTGQHLARVKAYCELLAERLAEHPRYRALITPQFVTTIRHASPLHDIGKVGIPDAILLKPGRLTPEEFAVMRRHSEIGARTLEAVHARYPRNEIVAMGIAITRSHHERWDGGGYPDGLAGEAIPLPARILALADVYDALRSQRPYKPSFPHAESCAIIQQGRGSQFDPDIVAAFDAIEGQFACVAEQLASATAPGAMAAAD